MASNSVYGHEGYRLLVVVNYCCGGNSLGEESKGAGRRELFGLVYLGGVIRENVFVNGGDCFFEHVGGISERRIFLTIFAVSFRRMYWSLPPREGIGA